MSLINDVHSGVRSGAHSGVHTDAPPALPPGPSLPTALQSLMFIVAPYQMMPRWHRRFGDVFSVSLAPAGHAIVLADPEHIREVFAGQPATRYPKDGINDHVVSGADTVRPDGTGTKAAFHHVVTIGPGETVSVATRLRVGEPSAVLPPLVGETVGRDVGDLIYERLADLAPGGAPVDTSAFRPRLAARWMRW